MDWQSTLLFLASAFAAQVIGTMAGFGAATILTPVASFFMPMKTAIAVVACFHLFANASRLIYFGRNINWKVVAQFGLAAVFFTVVGSAIMTRLPSSVIKLVFGAFILCYAVISVLVPHAIKLPTGSSILVGGGVISGFIAGFIGTGGAVRSACLIAFGLTKEIYLGTSASIALAVDATRLPVYLAGNFIPAAWIGIVLSLIPIALAGAWLGKRLIRRVSVVLFRRFVLVMLALMGLKLILDGLNGLA